MRQTIYILNKNTTPWQCFSTQDAKPESHQTSETTFYYKSDEYSG